ncbi:MAG: hypothetical protein JOZ70_01895 [Pseudolabrys sp.]|nr:hypothetical protein [Pseudolabrys sp.]MBV9953978.1 hypothetical protein [Pseudolabrys sp.]
MGMALRISWLPLLLAVGILFGALIDVKAAPVSAAAVAQPGSDIVLAQAKPKKDETLKQKAKRVWKNIAGHKFNVACPAFLPINRSTCTETGKSQADAQAKCQAKNSFCWVSAAN